MSWCDAPGVEERARGPYSRDTRPCTRTRRPHQGSKALRCTVAVGPCVYSLGQKTLNGMVQYARGLPSNSVIARALFNCRRSVDTMVLYCTVADEHFTVLHCTVLYISQHTDIAEAISSAAFTCRRSAPYAVYCNGSSPPSFPSTEYANRLCQFPKKVDLSPLSSFLSPRSPDISLTGCSDHIPACTFRLSAFRNPQSSPNRPADNAPLDGGPAARKEDEPNHREQEGFLT